jgi:uncharacterized membrane protein
MTEAWIVYTSRILLVEISVLLFSIKLSFLSNYDKTGLVEYLILIVEY